MSTTRLSMALGAAMLAIAASPVAAQDAPEKEFDGPYIGVAGGYDIQGNDVDEKILFDTNLDNRFGDGVRTAGGADAFSPGFCNGRARSSAPGNCQNDRDDFTYAVRAGYDRQMGNIVVGLVGEFGKTNISDSVSAFSTTPASYTMTREVEYFGNVRLRGGYAANKSLLYVTGGGALINLKRRFETTNTANSFVDNDEDLSFGFQAGGGIEHKFSRHVSFGLEYMYNQFDDADYSVFARRGTAPATNPFVLVSSDGTAFRRSDDHFRYHSLRATLNFRF